MTHPLDQLLDLGSLGYGQSLSADRDLVRGFFPHETLVSAAERVARSYELEVQVFSRVVMFTRQPDPSQFTEEPQMGPARGTPEFEAQADQVHRLMRTSDARTDEEENSVLLMFVTDESFSRDAIMMGLGRWKVEKREEAKS